MRPTRALRFLLILVLCGFVHAAFASAPQASADPATLDRQLLVMLRVPPAHYRPDANYLGGYGSQFGRVARKRVAEDIAGEFNLRIVDDWPMPSLGVDCFVMESAEDAALDRVVESLARDPRVESIQRMNLFHVLAYDDPLFPFQPTANAWHLADLHQLATGRSVRIAAIDSGVELDHPDLRGQVSLARNFVDARENVGEAHGTAVAGIIAAKGGNGVGIVGVAPQANLMALRACWQTAAGDDAAVCSSFTLAKALQFALDREAKIINLSLGGPRDRLLERLLQTALARGAVIIAAVDPAIAGGGFPASMAGVLAVAADNAHDSPPATFVAPGRDIPATLPGKRWGMVKGSSFAAAEMAGLVALLLELAPNQKPQQIRETLAFSETVPATSSRSTLVDACAAVARTTGACACRCRTTALGEGATLTR